MLITNITSITIPVGEFNAQQEVSLTNSCRSQIQTIGLFNFWKENSELIKYFTYNPYKKIDNNIYSGKFVHNFLGNDNFMYFYEVDENGVYKLILKS